MATIDRDDLVVISNSIAVGTSTVQLDTSTSGERLTSFFLQADEDNSGNVYIGSSDVSANDSFTLDAGERIEFKPVERLGKWTNSYNLAGFYALGSAPTQRLKILKIKRQGS